MVAGEIHMRAISLAFVLVACAAEPDKQLHAPATAAQQDPDLPRSCDGKYFPISVNHLARQCCQTNGFTYHVAPPNRAGGVAIRELGKLACSQKDGSTNCGDDCYYGPCFAARARVIGLPPGHVFEPSNGAAMCGWEAALANGVQFDPEPYTNQELYPDIESACIYSGCAPGGVRTVALEVVADASAASGRVTSSPGGIDITGSGAQSASFGELDQRLTAQPAGRHARAVFSGDCTAAGDWGKRASCDLKLGPDKTVTVTWECEPGFDCAG
jgi:hypothetical protein